MKRKPTKKSAGFTIIEALLSMIILAIVITAGASIFFYAQRIQTVAEHKKIATEIATAEMEDLRSRGQSFFTWGAGAPPIITPITISGFIYQINVSYSDASDSGTPYKRVVVSVTWTDANSVSARTITFITYL